MKKNIFAAVLFIIIAAFNACQMAPTEFNYLAAFVFSALAAVLMVSSKKETA